MVQIDVAMGKPTGAREESREKMRDGQDRGVKDRRYSQQKELQKAKPHTPHSIPAAELRSPKSWCFQAAKHPA